MQRLNAKCDHLKTGFEPQGLNASRCENCHMTSDVDICYTSRFVRFIQSFMDMYALSRTANSLENAVALSAFSFVLFGSNHAQCLDGIL